MAEPQATCQLGEDDVARLPTGPVPVVADPVVLVAGRVVVGRAVVLVVGLVVLVDVVEEVEGALVVEVLTAVEVGAVVEVLVAAGAGSPWPLAPAFFPGCWTATMMIPVASAAARTMLKNRVEGPPPLLVLAPVPPSALILRRLRPARA